MKLYSRDNSMSRRRKTSKKTRSRGVLGLGVGLLGLGLFGLSTGVTVLSVSALDAATVPDSALLNGYQTAIAQREREREELLQAGGSARGVSFASAAAGSNDNPGTTTTTTQTHQFVVRVDDSLLSSTEKIKAALVGLGSGCSVLGTVANLPGHFLVECESQATTQQQASALHRRQSLASAPGIVDVELQVPESKFVKRKPIPQSNTAGFDALSDEWKEELRSRIEEAERDARAAVHHDVDKRSILGGGALEKRTVLSTAEVDAAFAKLGIKDPGIKRQWHIYNNATPTADLNVTGVWLNGITGKNSIVCIIDDGLDSTNPDLTANFYKDGSWDFNTPSQAPMPQPQNAEDNHGTRCSGEIGAVKNDVCGVGVSYDAKVSGVRILSAPITNADEASATNFEYQKNQIYSCSWGPPDDGASLDRPASLSQKSYVEAVTNGRGGKGNIYVFAAGNGGENYDNCNYDGFVNQIYTIAIASIDYQDRHPSYSELCPAIHAVSPSSPSPQYGPSIYTSDKMPGQCTGTHTGTSASAPLVSGVFALALEANPNLSWRDAQQLLYDTAVVVNPDDSSWDTMSTGRKYSNKFGFGKIDAYALVEAAKNMVPVGQWTNLPYVGKTLNKAVPHGSTGVSDSISITQEQVTNAGLATVEHLQVYVTVTHPVRGQLKYEIVSPAGVKTLLADTRPYDVSSQGLNNWTFTSLKYWGDSNPVGDWTITVKDPVDATKTGVLVSWGIKLWGAGPRDGSVVTTSSSKTATSKTTSKTASSKTTTVEPTMDASTSSLTTTSKTTRTISVTGPITVATTTSSLTSSTSRPGSAGRKAVGVLASVVVAAAALFVGL